MDFMKYVNKIGYKPLALLLALWLVVGVFWHFSWLLFLLFLFGIFIYKNPSRELACNDAKAILVPLDGELKAIKKIMHQDLGECLELVIKNSLFSPGSIRASSALEIKDVKVRHGLFAFAGFSERIFLLCQMQEIQFGIRISPGSLDRKIKIFDEKSEFEAGEELGFTLNGEVSLLLPKDTRLLVGLNDTLKANSLLGYFA